MATIGLFYSSSTGNTENAAELIKEEFGKLSVEVELNYVGQVELTEMLKYDKLILGVPTWNIGELEADWDIAFPEMDDLDLSGKQVACFGLGDQYGYADTYQDAMGMLAQKARKCGAALVGCTSTEGHEFSDSMALDDGQFMGLALDDDNQFELTPQRISDWVQQLKSEFKLNLQETA